ncbi:MAG: hypothetical protein NVSMB6_22980 [Burkholderiaceae bacterium]
MLATEDERYRAVDAKWCASRVPNLAAPIRFLHTESTNLRILPMDVIRERKSRSTRHGDKRFAHNIMHLIKPPCTTHALIIALDKGLP